MIKVKIPIYSIKVKTSPNKKYEKIRIKTPMRDNNGTATETSSFDKP